MAMRVSNTHGRPSIQKALRAAVNTKSDSFDLVSLICGRLFLATGSSYSADLYTALTNRDWTTLANAYVDPSDYKDANSYFMDKQCESFLRKYPFPGTAAAAKKRARETFTSGERGCALTNDVLRLWNQGKVKLSPDVESAIFAARQKISVVLGKLNVKEWLQRCAFGPGTVIGVAGTSDYAKLRECPSVTDDLLPFAEALVTSCPAWHASITNGYTTPLRFEVCQGGRYSTVRKDAKTDRNIEVQPLMNAYLQSGLGKLIRQRLKHSAGINLNDQTRNQELARIGSINGFWATMDLSNASDTICTNLVRLLFPYDWLQAMELTRTRKIEVDGEVQHLHRFSSMGNGFTFELESLIFWALSSAACESCGYFGPIAVYGDDIIVPATCFESVSSVLQTVGFAVNKKKSFFAGPFRESCGADWFNGINVRPYFLKEDPQDVASLISLANGLRRSAGRSNHNIGYDRRFASAWYTAVRGIPVPIRRRLAFGYTLTDDFILSGNAREGMSIHFVPKSNPDLNFYPAKATALYRLDSRAGTYVDNVIRASAFSLKSRIVHHRDQVFGVLNADWLPGRCSSLNGNGHVCDYRRDSGEWMLKKEESVILKDPTAIWW